MITQEELKKLVTYNPETGAMFFKARVLEYASSESHLKRWNTRFAGNELNSLWGNYYSGHLLNKRYRVHRLVWLYVYGYIPKCIDHINGVTTDNRLENLREVSLRKNAMNRCKPKHNTSGHMGVSFDKQTSKWRPHITVNGKIKNLGRFEDINDAITARRQAEIEHGFHKNHGRDQKC